MKEVEKSSGPGEAIESMPRRLGEAESKWADQENNKDGRGNWKMGKSRSGGSGFLPTLSHAEQEGPSWGREIDKSSDRRRYWTGARK
ncbi:hypothetical protein GGTG_06789 [Gaeumannomyces tritici R3-111a-1]|uniref:Uncharacterized protein n=1 Tax=Gaeumannomyces tritici (strain R3-111a-1) TaxID=644352 RepID=J3NZU2_GAET3|nr:hypothetical protein GGTG_06789 [Gaeumannomyces tritici R3-111a-1]EJT76875.1 hypothetical protein GGTG_06789 [Gaeumannomyces tritici R3-111a-1]